MNAMQSSCSEMKHIKGDNNSDSTKTGDSKNKTWTEKSKEEINKSKEELGASVKKSVNS